MYIYTYIYIHIGLRVNPNKGSLATERQRLQTSARLYTHKENVGVG